MIPQTEATFLLAEQIEVIYSNKKEEGPYTNNVERIDPVSTTEYAEKVDREKMNPEIEHTTYTRSRLKIQSNQNGFKMIGFTNSKKR